MYFKYLVETSRKLMSEKGLNELGSDKWRLIDIREVEVQKKVSDVLFADKRWRHTFIKEEQ